ANCKSGVDLTVPVDEGLIYKWDKAEWSGNIAFTGQQLTDLLGMQTGQPANGVKIEKAAREIQKAYGRKGYLMSFVRSMPNFDDNAQKVAYRMEVREGSQFRMCQFVTKGFPEAIDKRIHERWNLKPGDIFDDGYSVEFSKNQLSELMRSLFLERRALNKPSPSLKWERNLNRTALTVDVVLELTN